MPSPETWWMYCQVRYMSYLCLPGYFNENVGGIIINMILILVIMVHMKCLGMYIW